MFLYKCGSLSGRSAAFYFIFYINICLRLTYTMANEIVQKGGGGKSCPSVYYSVVLVVYSDIYADDTFDLGVLLL